MRFFVRLFIEIALMIFVVITATRVLSEEHPGVAGMILVSMFVVALAFRVATQSERIKDDARERRRLEKAFVTAVEDAGWPHLVTVHHDRKVVSHYIETPDFRSVDDAFYIETPLSEESLGEQTQLADLLSPEEIDELYAGTDEVEDKDEEVNDTTTAAEE